MSVDLVAYGIIPVDKKKSQEMKKRYLELDKKGVDFEQYPQDLKTYIEKSLNPDWYPGDPGWPDGEVEIKYKDSNNGEYANITIDVSKLPKNVTKIQVGMS